mgnify:CR=1 FL=1
MLTHGILAGQAIRTNNVSIQTPVTYDYLQDVKVHFLASYSFGRHAPFAGISFPVNDSPMANYGFSAGYKFFPNKLKQTFDFYFLYLLQGDSRKLYSNSDVKGFSLQNRLGYGFNVYLNDRLYIVHHVAAGIENAWFAGYEVFTDVSLTAGLGIGVKIGNKSKTDEE